MTSPQFHFTRTFSGAFFLLALSASITTFAQPLRWIPSGGPKGGIFRSVAVDREGRIFAVSSDAGLYASSNLIFPWSWIPTGATGPIRVVFCSPDGAIYLGVDTVGVLRSTDHGISWMNTSAGFGSWPASAPLNVQGFCEDSSGGLFAGTNKGLFRTTDRGEAWSRVDTGQTIGFDASLLFHKRSGCLFSRYGKLRQSTDGGFSWRVVKFGEATGWAWSLFVTSAGDLVAVTPNGVFGGTAKPDSLGKIGGAFDSTSNAVYGSCIGNRDEIFLSSTDGKIHRTTNFGRDWTSFDFGMYKEIAWSLVMDRNSTLYAGTNGNGIRVSTDLGETWAEWNEGLWALPIRSMASDPSGALYAVSTFRQFLYKLPAVGAGWVNLSARDTLQHQMFYQVASDRLGTLFAAASGYPVQRSTDGGVNWEPRSFGIIFKYVTTLGIAPDGTLFAGGSDGVYRSTDEGNYWYGGAAGIPSTSINAFAFHPNGKIYAGTNNGVFLSDDGGVVWSAINGGLTQMKVNALLVTAAGRIFAGTLGGIFRSNDFSGNWDDCSAGLADKNVYALCLDANGTLYAGTGHGVFRSTDDGDGWSAFSEGLNALPVSSLAFTSSGHLYAGTLRESVYRTESPVTGVPQISRAVDAVPELLPNFPNPCAGHTIMPFLLRRASHIRIEILDRVGRIALRLPDEDRPAGASSVRLDTAPLESGIYFVRLFDGYRRTVRAITILK